MNIIQKLKLFFWDHSESDSFIESEERERKYKLLKYTLTITFPLTLFYSYLFFINESYENAWIQLIDGLLFIIALLLHIRTRNTKLWANSYALLGGISIYCTMYYTGGLYSVATPWIVTHAPTIILLAGKRAGFIWWMIDILLISIFGAMHYYEYDFPSTISKFTSTLSNILNGTFGLVNFMFLVATIFENGKNSALRKLNENNKLLAKEKARSEELLLNILPEHVAEELKNEGKSRPKHFESVSVLFTDFENFTGHSQLMSPDDLVNEIDLCFKAFDDIMDKHGLEKIKTIGDAYLAVSGLPNENPNHAINASKAALDIIAFVEANKQLKMKTKETFFEIRVGIHSGSVVAGIVGHKKFAYDIWGDTVNTASRMESSGEIGKVNISESTYEFIKDKFDCKPRGKVEAKRKGMIEMYFVMNEKEANTD